MPPKAREIEKALGAELLEQLRYFAQHQTEWTERLAGQIVNHTLEVWSGTFDTTAVITRDYQVAAGSVRIVLPEGGVCVVSSAGPAATAPTGLGTWIIGHADAGYASEVIPLASRQFTLYGTSTQKIQFQVFTALVRPDTHGLVAFPPAA